MKKKLIMGFAVAIFVYYAILFLIISSFFYQGYYVLEPVEQEKFRAIYDKWQNFDQKEFDDLVASILVNGKNDTYSKAGSIFRWMNNSDNMKNIYGEIKSQQPIKFGYNEQKITYSYYNVNGTVYIRYMYPDPVWVYITGYGCCGEYSVLFNELAKRAGIECRIITLTYKNESDSHMFNEIMLENGTWVYVDTNWPTNKPIGKPSDCDYLVNRGIDKSRIAKIAVYNLNGSGEDLTSKYICKEQP